MRSILPGRARAPGDPLRSGGGAAVLLLLALATPLLPGCARFRAAPPPAVAAPPPPPTWSAMTAERLYSDNAGGIEDSLRLVVQDAAQFREVWARATSRQQVPPPAPEVDFAREMLLVVAAGRRSAEDRIRVDSVGVQRTPAARGQPARETMAVVVRLSEGCRRFTTDAYPLEIVRVPRHAGEVEWIERRAPATDCAR